MEAIMNIIDSYSKELLIVSYIFLIIIIMVLVILMVKLSKLSKLHKEIIRTKSGINLEEMLINQKIQVDDVKTSQEQIKNNISSIEKSLSVTFSKSNLYKYDAFSDSAGKLSFVYVLLNSFNTGIIVNGIFGNEGHYLYIKEVIDGKTEKELSREERVTLDKAIKDVI